MRSYNTIMNDVKKEILDLSFTDNAIVNKTYTIWNHHVVVGFQGNFSYTSTKMYDVSEKYKDINTYDVIDIDLMKMTLESIKSFSIMCINNFFGDKFFVEVEFKNAQSYLFKENLMVSNYINESLEDNKITFRKNNSVVLKNGDDAIIIDVTIDNSKIIHENKVRVFFKKKHYCIELNVYNAEVALKHLIKKMFSIYRSIFVPFAKMSDNQKKNVMKLFGKKEFNYLSTPIVDNEYVTIYTSISVCINRKTGGHLNDSDYIKIKYKKEIDQEIVQAYISKYIFNEDAHIEFFEKNESYARVEYENGIVFATSSSNIKEHIYFAKTKLGYIPFDHYNVEDYSYQHNLPMSDYKKFITELYFEHQKNIQMMMKLDECSYIDVFKTLRG